MPREATALNTMGWVGGRVAAAPLQPINLSFMLPSLDPASVQSTKRQPPPEPVLFAQQQEKSIFLAESARTSRSARPDAMPSLGPFSARAHGQQHLPPALRLPSFSKPAREDPQAKDHPVPTVPPQPRPAGAHAPARKRIVIELDRMDGMEPVILEQSTSEDLENALEREAREARAGKTRPSRQQAPRAAPPPIKLLGPPLPRRDPYDEAPSAGASLDAVATSDPSAIPKSRSTPTPPPWLAASIKLPIRLQARLDELHGDPEAAAAFEAHIHHVLKTIMAPSHAGASYMSRSGVEPAPSKEVQRQLKESQRARKENAAAAQRREQQAAKAALQQARRPAAFSNYNPQPVDEPNTPHLNVDGSQETGGNAQGAASQQVAEPPAGVPGAATKPLGAARRGNDSSDEVEAAGEPVATDSSEMRAYLRELEGGPPTGGRSSIFKNRDSRRQAAAIPRAPAEVEVRLPPEVAAGPPRLKRKALAKALHALR